MKKKRTMDNQTIYNKAVELYDGIGASAVCEYANKLNLPYHYCTPCDSHMPTLDKSCLVCGSDITIMKQTNK